MKAPVSWIREYVALPEEVGVEELTRRLTMLGLKLEGVEAPGDQITGPLVVGRVLTISPEPQKNGKTINWCTVDVGPELNATHGTDAEGVGIVCGAHNFGAGDLVVVVLPGGVLPGGFAISARKTYGHVSTGMICSARELGLGEDHDGIIVLPPEAGAPGDGAVAALGLDDAVIEFEINPDRAYALSLRGIARETALGFGLEFTDPGRRAVPAANGAGYPVLVHDAGACPVFVTREVTGLDPDAATPDWMVRRLTQVGMRPISLAVDVTNYVMLELGQPIHGYDRERLQGPIQVRRATAGEQLTTLDGARRDLDPADVLITDDSGPIGLAGVMGGAETELSPDTTDVVIEAACFDPASIFHTRRRHKLPSEASRRFERGVDPELAEHAADRVATLLVEHGGATLATGVTVVGVAPARRTVSIGADLPARVTGMEIGATTAESHLRAVGCAVAVSGETLAATVPSWRPDLTDPFDLVEEVARVVGYDRVPSVLPPAPSGRGLTSTQRLRRRVGTVLAGEGLTEVISYPFVGEPDLDALGLATDDVRRRALRVENPLSAEQPLLATTLLPGLLGAVARNVGRGIGDVALFEASHVFRPTSGTAAPILPVDRAPTASEWSALTDAVPPQPLHLALALCGRRELDGWWGEGRAADWADALGIVTDVAAYLGVTLEPVAATQAPWHPGRCAELRVGDVALGHAGELHPRACRALGLPSRTVAAEIDLSELLIRASEPRGPQFSAYPVAKEDVALVVDAAVPAATVAAALRTGAGELLESVRLFDVYTGDQVAAGQKSLAFALRFRAAHRTLAEGEAAAARDAAVARATERTGARQRT